MNNDEIVIELSDEIKKMNTVLTLFNDDYEYIEEMAHEASLTIEGLIEAIIEEKINEWLQYEVEMKGKRKAKDVKREIAQILTVNSRRMFENRLYRKLLQKG